MFKTRDAKTWQREFPVGFPVRVFASKLLVITIFARIESRCVIKARAIFHSKIRTDLQTNTICFTPQQLLKPSFLRRLPSGDGSCCNKNLVSVFTLKQNIGDTSHGFTNIKSNRNISRSEMLSSSYISVKLIKMNIFPRKTKGGRCILSKVVDWVTRPEYHGCWWHDETRSQGLYSLSGKTSYRKISWTLEAARFEFRLFQSLWNLTGTSGAALPIYLLNIRAIRFL